MKSPFARHFGSALFGLGLALAALPGAARADAAEDLLGPGHWRLVASPFSYHFHYSPDHRYVWALGAERQRDDNWLLGAAYFSNSFGQPSAYLYVGKRWPGLFGLPQFYAQVTGGLMYGYRGQYQHKVPLNYNGFSPGVLPTLGWQLDRRASVSVHLLGNAGFMVQLGYELR
jgi:hypothetical protein